MFRSARYSVIVAVAAFVAALAGCGGAHAPSVHSAIARPAGLPTWTVQVEDVVVVHADTPPDTGSYIESNGKDRIWFTRGVGWRMEADSMGEGGEYHRVFVTDGSTFWAYDPVSNRYTQAPFHDVVVDPRIGNGVMMVMAGTYDLQTAISALKLLPYAGSSVSVDGTEVILGRVTQQVSLIPCTTMASASSNISASGTTPSSSGPEAHCEGTERYWLDTETGWALKASDDDGHGGGYTWDTVSATFDALIDPSLFQFTPPPGSQQVDSLQ